MKIISITDLRDTERDVAGVGFHSLRFLIESDNMGFTICQTEIEKGGPYHWHYTKHLEACYCVSGEGVLENLTTREKSVIKRETMYVLDKHDDHEFTAIENVVLISVFNPPLKGNEIHRKDGSYE